MGRWNSITTIYPVVFPSPPSPPIVPPDKENDNDKDNDNDNDNDNENFSDNDNLSDNDNDNFSYIVLFIDSTIAQSTKSCWRYPYHRRYYMRQ